MTLTLSNLHPAKGAKHKPKRIGCGEGSGHGGSGSTRGMKGQRSRSGEHKNPGFEGGQMPLVRRIPKRGFSNKKFNVEYQEVRLDDILKKLPADISEVNVEVLKKFNLIKSVNKPVKIISGNIRLNRKIKLFVHKATKSVIRTLMEAGGEYVQLNC